jgi:hypothetical protein
MRKWLSVAAVLAAGLVSAGTASADTPSDVYSDFAEDGALSCGHSRAALNGVLRDASIHQYGDPYTLLGLKLAVRKQLAGGCRRTTQAAKSSSPPSEEAGRDAEQREENALSEPPPPGPGGDPEPTPSRPDASPDGGEALGSVEEKRDGRMLLVGIGLLLFALASGGWAAKRAHTDRPDRE